MTKDNQNRNPFFNHKGRLKDSHFEAQMKKVFEAFYKQPKTMMMVEVETDVMRSNITWYVRKWKKQGIISKVGDGICPITKYPKVGYYTTNPDLVPINCEPLKMAAL